MGPSEREAAADEMSNSTSHQDFDNCISNILSRHIFFPWFATYLLFLPVFLFILYIGFNKRTTSQSSASGGLSHSDVFTLNMVAMEIISVVGSCVICYGFLCLDHTAASIGGDTLVSTMTGQVLFHTLTCVERYLAVVHPVTYLRLKREGGVTIRNISITFVWAFSLVYTLLFRFIVDTGLFYVTSALLMYFTPLPLVSYCSVYVLCVLIRPKPGERVGPRKQLDKSKRFSVYTVVAILGVLILRLVAKLINNSLHLSPKLKVDGCVVAMLTNWTALPSSLVLPLLFLYRAGKLTGCNA